VWLPIVEKSAREGLNHEEHEVNRLFVTLVTFVVMSRQGALQLSIESPYDSFLGPGELRHLLVMLERNGRDDLIFGRASRNLILDSVSCIHEDD
jgi:hypothetical protein